MNITVEDLNNMRTENKPHTLLDIREIEEVNICSIEGSLNIPMNTLPDNLDKLPKHEPLVVMCHVGGRSIQVTQWLSQNGFDNVVNLDGGISAWSNVIDASMPQY